MPENYSKRKTSFDSSEEEIIIAKKIKIRKKKIQLKKWKII